MNGQQIDKLERRFTSAPAARPHVTRNRDADSAGRIQGYASIWYDGSAGSEYVLPSGLREHVVRGAFSDTIKSDRIACLFNHDINRVCATNWAGTLTLKEDAKGLLYSADLPNTESGREIIELVSRGDIASSSFGFIPVRQRFAEHDGLTVRLLEQVKLMDVSCTLFGAYCGTSVGVVGESSAPGRANPPSGNYPELDHPNPETRKLLMKLRLDAIEDDMLDDERFFHEQAEREWELNEFLSELRVRAAQVKAIELGAELDFDDLETYS